MGFGPRGVRNFWVDLEVAGREHRVKTGPVGERGGFFMKVYIREAGQISDAYLTVQGVSDGDLNTLFVKLHDGKNAVREMELSTSRNDQKGAEEETVALSEVEERPETRLEIMKREKAFWRIKGE